MQTVSGGFLLKARMRFPDEMNRSDALKQERVWFWFKAGKVDQIAVFASYRGRTKEGLGISSTREEVEYVYGHLEWDGCWLINVPPFGIGFDFGDLPTNFTQVTGIYIFRE